VTAGPRVGRHGGRFDLSVRGLRLSRPGRTGWALIGLVVASIVIDGARGFAPAFPRGDLLYHWGLTHGILRGEFPPGGPYAGLPAYYPPGFHLLLALITSVASISVADATLLFGFAWLPVLPLATFALARHMTGRSDIALVAAALTIFGGAYDFGGDRLWVNSLFLVGHQFYPLFPRDLVFGLLPLAVFAFLRALEADRGWPWAVLAGGLLGACAVIQVQLLLPIPIALLVVALATAVLDPSRRRSATLALVVTGGLTALAIAPWLLDTVATIRRNGGVALDSAESLVPARIGLWDYPREFGLFLPLAVVGAGLVLVHLRYRDPAVSFIRPPRPEAPLVLIPWFVVPWAMAVFYDPGWPLEDALRPQRLWLLSSQPGAILAAIGLVALAQRFVGSRWNRPRLVRPAIVAVFLLAAVPTVVFTLRLLSQTWLQPQYAHLVLDRDHVPDMASLLGDSGPRAAVLTYEDWSSLVWYETGSWVVAVKPPGYAKLAFDPKIFTGISQAMRRNDIARAFRGDPAQLVSVADSYGAERILLARRGDEWGVIHQVAAVAAKQPGGMSGSATVVDGNGWDAVALEPGGRVVIAPAPAATAGPISIEIRFLGAEANRAVPDRRVRLIAVGAGGERDVGDLVVPATGLDEWQVVRAAIGLQPGERLAIEAVDGVTVQSVMGFVATGPPNGWQTVRTTPDAVVLERIR
jgi:hypothetical protein